MTERVTPAKLRADADREVAAIGSRRVRLLAELEAVEAELRPVVRRAVECEVSQRRISALTGLSTTTIGKWLKEKAG